jgi:hypothetical protein
VQSAVGVDIGCGMIAARSDLVVVDHVLHRVLDYTGT